MSNIATFAGRRRSEKKVPHPYDGLTDEQIRDKNEENNPRFPGYHTVIVPKMNALGPGYPDETGEYLSMGYEILSDDPQVTGHANNVVMGIRLDKHYANQSENEAGSVGRLHELIDTIKDEVAERVEAGPRFNGAKAKLARKESGLVQGEPIEVGYTPDVEDEAPAPAKRGRPKADPDQ